MKFYIYKNAYWENPDDIVPEGAVEVTKRPDFASTWDGAEWVKDATLSRAWMITQVEVELLRLKKFMLLPAQTVEGLRGVLDPYVAALQGAIKSPPSDNAMPAVPLELTDDAFYA